MNLFPSRVYKVELPDGYTIAFNHLKQNTKHTDLLVLESTDRAFIGMVNENSFKVISSAKYGAFCVLSGDFQEKVGSIKIRIHITYKILSSILVLLPILSIVLTLSQREVENPIGLILPALLGIVFVRFVIIELNFRIISKKVLKKLIEIIRISHIINVA
ncbi:hypothetical protein [uncultured Pontibacter sp.]|uniref:hypothetical protein n=1 Tax=uncultured Pontibacter sp. TaxID=453356 RepID=UPI00261FAC8B|nr:hypothetical protein [uncultured Pontibacter sp.]